MFVAIVEYTVALYTLQNPISEYPFEQHVQSKQRRIEMNEKIKKIEEKTEATPTISTKIVNWGASAMVPSETKCRGKHLRRELENAEKFRNGTLLLLNYLEKYIFRDGGLQ